MPQKIQKSKSISSDNNQTINLNPDGYIIWIDCEMTGLDVQECELVEVGLIITDKNLNPLDSGINILIKPSQKALDSMEEFVRNMHTSSGLLEELEDGVSLEKADNELFHYVRRFLNAGIAPPLAGNSIATDRKFIDKYLPRLSGLLHYRMIDVSSISELAKRWNIPVYIGKPEKNGGHRAIDDIKDSIEELDYYRNRFIIDYTTAKVHNIAIEQGNNLSSGADFNI